jgi:hypothetical protein
MKVLGILNKIRGGGVIGLIFLCFAAMVLFEIMGLTTIITLYNLGVDHFTISIY